MPNENNNNKKPKNNKQELINLVKDIGLEVKQSKSVINKKEASKLEKENFPEVVITWFILREFLFYYYNTNNGSNTNYVNELHKIVKHIIPISQYININLDEIIDSTLRECLKFVEDTNNEKYLTACKKVMTKIGSLQK